MTIKRCWLGLLAFALLLCVPLTSAHAQASRTWVSGVGDDVNPCSRTAPCKTFAGAISKTAAGGEIDCLDPAGYGAVTITKAMTIDCGYTLGSVLVSGTNGIVVSAGPADKVVLRGISINGIGTGINGIRFLSGAQLTVENCFISGFTTQGIDIALAAAAKVFITHTIITKVGNDGIRASTTAGALLVYVENTTIENPAVNGIEAASSQGMNINNSLIGGAGNAVLVSAGGAQVNLDSSSINSNNNGINVTASGATVRVANNTFYNNGANFVIAAGGQVASNNSNRISASGGVAPNATLSTQ